MSPDPSPPREFGRTPAQAVRAAFILAALGCGAIVTVERYLTRPSTPLGEAFARTGIPPLLPLVVGITVVLAFAGMGLYQSLRTAPRFRLTESGFTVRGTLGTYTLEWANLTAADVTRAGLVFRIADREAFLRTHQGTPQQREWLRTMEPYGDWDFLFPRAELGHPPDQVLTWLQPHLIGVKSQE